MNDFDSSAVEALAFSYLSHGLLVAVHNLWTWVAVVTAALSFWRIRVRLSISATATASVVVTHSTPRPVDPIPETDESNASTSAPSPVTSNNPVTTPESALNGVTRRRKFSIKFQGDGEESAVKDERLKLTERRSSDGDGDGEWWGRWEKMLTTKQGRNTWYRYQDVTAINGNVVRLWDNFECRSRCSVVR